MASYAREIHRPSMIVSPGEVASTLEGPQVDLSLEMSVEAAKSSPQDPNAWNTLAAAYIQDGRWQEGYDAAKQALDLDPHFGVALFNLSLCQLADGDYQAAIKIYRKLLETEPDFLIARSNLLFCIDLMNDTTPEEALAERMAWRRSWHEKPSYSFEHLARDPNRILRVGYIGSQWVDHSSTRCFAPVVSNHDPAAVHTVIYCCRSPESCDGISQQFQKLPNVTWRWSHDLTGGALADMVYADNIDILVDLAGHTEGGRLRTFCLKPAPIQVTAWGYVTGTGCPEVDYILADPVLIPPEEEAGFVEKVEYLPVAVPWDPQGYTPLVERPPAFRGGFVSFGCLNRTAKITNETFDLYARVLQRVPNSRMIFKSADYDHPAALDRVLNGMTSRGIHRDRLGVLGGSITFEHLRTYWHVDLVLDPIPHSGGLTALEGLWMGVPPVTLIGRRPVSRLSASFLTAIGLPEFIATTADEYVDIAERSVANLQHLAMLRATMRERMRKSPLMGPGYVAAVEASYRKMWHRWLGVT